MFEAFALSPLAEYSTQDGTEIQFRGVTISELPIMEHFNLRFQPIRTELLDWLQESLAIPIPQSPNTFNIQDNILCAWLGPDEYLVVSPPDKADRVAEDLERMVTNQFATFTRLSSAQTIIRITGENSIDFLGRGISIDLHPSQFSFGQCAQTVMAHSNVMILNHTRDNPLLDIVVRRSFADHLWRWLLDVGKESEFRL